MICLFEWLWVGVCFNKNLVVKVMEYFMDHNLTMDPLIYLKTCMFIL